MLKKILRKIYQFLTLLVIVITWMIVLPLNIIILGAVLMHSTVEGICYRVARPNLNPEEESRVFDNKEQELASNVNFLHSMYQKVFNKLAGF